MSRNGDFFKISYISKGRMFRKSLKTGQGDPGPFNRAQTQVQNGCRILYSIVALNWGWTRLIGG